MPPLPSTSLPALAAEKVNLGVSIPAATHSFMGGINYWANQAKKDLEKEHKDLKITIKTAANAPEQANQLQDLSTVTKINALVIFPFESAALTKPVAQVKAKGAYVTVVDRGLTDTSAQDAYVAGDNTAFGKIPAEYIVKKLGGKGNVVALRGIATTLDNERMDAFNAVLKNHPDIKLLDAKYANWNRDDAFKVTQDYLTRFKRSTPSGPPTTTWPWACSRPSSRPSATTSRSSSAAPAPRAWSRPSWTARTSASTADVSYSPKFIYDAIKLTAEARLKGEKLPATTIIPSVLITEGQRQETSTSPTRRSEVTAEIASRKLRYAMVGGGRDAFIGGVHRKAMALDGQMRAGGRRAVVEPGQGARLGPRPRSWPMTATTATGRRCWPTS